MNGLVVGFIGFGEAAFHICKGLKEEGIKEIYSFDTMRNHPTLGGILEERAALAQVNLVDNLETLISKSNLVFCATSAKYAVSIAREVSSYISEGQCYVDLNSASPQVKKEISSYILGSNAKFVDGAVMEPVPNHGHKVPIIASGDGAHQFKQLMSPYQMTITVLNDEPGSASAMKMCRSIFMKGFTSLLLETLSASNHFNIDKEILNSIQGTLSKQPLGELANLLITRTAIHAERRVTEMDEVIKTLETVNINPQMSRQTKEVLQSLVNMNLKDYFNSLVPESYQDVIKAIQSSSI